MAKQKISGVDDFVQKVTMHVPVTHTDVSRIERVPTSFSPKDRIAMVIHGVQYVFLDTTGVLPIPWSTVLTAIDDGFRFGLCFVGVGGDAFVDPSSLGIIDYNLMQAIGAGTPTSYDVKPRDVIKDFSTLPSGGLIAHPSALYAFVISDDAAANFKMYTSLLYTYREISDELYRELWEVLVTARTT